MNSDYSDSIDHALQRALEHDDGQSVDVLRDFSSRLGRPVSTLYVLDAYNDPFYIGGPRQEAAEWFARIWHQLNIPIGYHYRRIHYRMISQSVPLPYYKGGNYENTNDHWTALNTAARDAVALGLIPSDAFVDRRNPDPIIYLAQPSDSQIEDIVAADPILLLARFYRPLLPRYGEFIPGIIPQNYHIEIWAEKSTMNDILLPLAQRYQVNLITGVGELTYTACRDFITRLDARPARIIYIADFDPAGRSMPVAVARKIEYELYRQGLLDRDVQVRPIILTHEQCVQYRLPRTPIKVTDRRAPGFEDRFGEGATELDALEALHPGVFAQIVRDEIKRYWNPNHDRDVQDQINDFRIELWDVQDRVYAEHRQEINAFEAEIDQLNAQLVAVNQQAADLLQRMKPAWQAMADKLVDQQPEPSLAAPDFDAVDEDDNPLFDSTRDYVEQIDSYKDFQGKPTTRRVRQPNRTSLVRPPPPPFRRGN